MKSVNTTLKRVVISLLCFSNILFAVGHSTKYLNPFELVYGGSNTIIYGDYASISSSVECVKNSGNDNCNNNYNSYLFNATTIYKNDVSTAIIPLNSSTETLNLPSDIDGSDILYAGLYWQGNITGKDSADRDKTFTEEKGGRVGRDKVSFMDAKSSVTTLTADKIWYHDFWGNGTGGDGGHRSFYQAYKDVTTIVKNSYTIGTTNNFTVGNIKATKGKDYGTYFWGDATASYNNVRIGFWGNWNLIVVYQHKNIKLLNPKPKPKNIAIFHGFDALIPLQANSTKSINVNVSGFLTPQQTPINAKMLFYGSGGEKKLSYDTLEIQNKKTASFSKISNATNPIDNAFNGSISTYGVPINGAISYYPGLDSDDFSVSSYMDTTQSSTQLRLTAKNIGGVGDQFFPGLMAFSTDVYEPNFCYDYAYKQLNRYFTEDNDGTQNPSIVGSVATNAPVEISIYLKNLVSSDVSVKNMTLSITDINSTQATYIRDSTNLALNTSLPTSLLDTAMSAVSDTFIKDIPIGDLNTNDYFYTYYSINPIIADLNMSLNVNASYTLHTSTVDIPYNLNLSSEIKMCSTSSFQYSADNGEFNVVHNDYYNLDTGGTKKYYNLPTQITKRVGNFKVISIDTNDTLTNTSAAIAVEIIDAAAFHSAFVSCQELASSISKKVWLVFDNQNAQAFDKNAINQAYTSGRTTLNPSSNLYKAARENAAFRTSYPLDSNGSIQLIEHVSPSNPKWKLKDFPSYGGQKCVNNPTATISSTCGSNGVGNGTGMDEQELTSCMECLYGLNTKLTCSRDNFSIRPEAFSLEFDDSNQTLSVKQKIVDNLSATTVSTDFAAGYKYNLEINATNFLDTSLSNGYTKLYGVFNLEDKTQYIWSPSLPLGGCNDESNTTLSYRIANGSINFDLSEFDQVGRYKFNILDTSWTTVDHNPIYMGHHTKTYQNGDDMFLKNPDGTIASDCVLNSSISKLENSVSLNGCNISSDHNNTPSGIDYQDIFVTFHPYRFDLTNISATIGVNNEDLNASVNPYIYMSDLSQDQNMSFHLNGLIVAEGENNSTLSNFVTQCYAKSMILDVNRTFNTPGNIAYQYRLNSDPKVDINASLKIALSDGNFTKIQAGTATTILNLNFDRNKTIPTNLESITFHKYDVNCSNLADCTFNANLINNKTTGGTKNLNDKTLLHYYGRTHAPRQRFVGTNGNALIYYEVYCNGSGCNKALLQDGLDSNSTDDPRWFINTKHTVNVGNAGPVTQKTTGTAYVTANTPTSTAPSTVALTYDPVRGYPYKATMQNNSSGWLIYNPFNDSTTNNEFEVEFVNGGSPWAGQHETNNKTKTNATTRTNRRTMW